MAGDLRPSDEDSALVERIWARRRKRGGRLTVRSMIGREVEARSLDEHGRLRRVAGTADRNEAGELVVWSGAEGVLNETAVPRDASVTAEGREPR